MIQRGLILAILLPVAASAAQPVRQDTADLQPAVNTSATAAQAPPSGGGAMPAQAATKARTRAATTPAATAATPKSTAKDRVELQVTQITGNRELPRVMYVVPWKHPDPGDLSGRPANSLLDEVLSPVDRDVFQRQNRYYNALKPDVAPGAVRPEDEK